MNRKAFFQEQNKKLKTQESEYNKMISFWIEKIEKSCLNKKEQKKRILELCHLVSFTISLKNRGIIKELQEIELIELSTEPDFIIKYKGEKLGLELRRVLNEKAQEIGQKRNFLNSVERTFKKKFPGIKVFASISFNKFFDFWILNNELIYNQTVDFIYSQVTNKEHQKPKFINSYYFAKHTNLSFNLSDGYILGNLDEEIKQGIISKDKKLKNYRAKTNLEKIWLLLVVSGASSDSDFSNFEENTFVCKNSFDAVFLLNDFKKNVYLLTKGWTNSNL